MKKLLSLLLVALCAVIVVPLSSCSKEIELTTDNYDKYITLSVNFDNIDVEYISDSNYFISCVYYVTAAPKGDYRFNDVALSAYCYYTYEDNDWSNLSTYSDSDNSFLTSYLTTKRKFDLDYYGYGRYSTYICQKATSAAFTLNSSSITVTISSISGTVTV